LSVFGSQRPQGKFYFLGQVASFTFFQRVVAQLLDHRGRRRPAHPHREQRPAAISGNGQEPWQERAAAVPGMQAPQSPHKTLLRDVFGILSMAQHAIAEAKYLPLMLLDQFHHGGLIAQQTSADQLTHVVGQRSRSLRNDDWSEENTAPERSKFQRSRQQVRAAL
jgi:hypothetical protein